MSEMLEKLAGEFAYRFGGFAMASYNNHFLAGVGVLTLAQDGTMTGKHKYSLLRLTEGEALRTGAYSLAGHLSMESDGTGSAQVLFNVTAGTTESSEAHFHVVLAGDFDRLWFISAGGERLGSGDPTTELTQLEAVRRTRPGG